VGEQLCQEQSAHQEAETQLQEERSALKEAQAALERERSAREEAQGHLERERAALETVQATIKLLDKEITRLSGELVQAGVSQEDLRQANKEKDDVILELQQAVATARASLESENKQVEGELLSLSLARWFNSFGIRYQYSSYICLQACGQRSGHQRLRRRPSRRPTTPPSRS
jgi:SMC interacting uncharacterized protein involved in chromosome segregation